MKFLFTTDVMQRGGKERQMLLLSRELLNSGHDVRILSVYETNLDYVREYGIESDRIDVIKDKNMVSKFKQTAKILENYKPDIVFAWDPISALFGLMLRKKIGFSFINGSIQHGVRLLNPSHLFRSLVCHLSPFVVANSNAGLRANNLKPGKKRFVLNNGIEDKFCNRMSRNEIIRKRKELIPAYAKKPGKVFISVANLLPFKDYFTVLDALQEIKDVYHFYYLILGEGPMRPALTERIRQCGLENQIFLLGRIEQVSEYLNLSDYMIHSSRGEGISNSILEGMYAGLPIIATDVGGVPETVFPASAALFKYKNVSQLKIILQKIDQLFLEFDKNGKAYMEHLEKFSVETMIGNFLKIVDQVKGN